MFSWGKNGPRRRAATVGWQPSTVTSSVVRRLRAVSDTVQGRVTMPVTTAPELLRETLELHELETKQQTDARGPDSPKDHGTPPSTDSRGRDQHVPPPLPSLPSLQRSCTQPTPKRPS